MSNGGHAQHAPSEVCHVLPGRSQSAPAPKAVRTEPLVMRALTRTNAAVVSRAESAIWSAIHVTGGSANVVLSRLPYTPTKGVISAMGRADSYSL